MALYICTRLLLFWARGYGVELVLCFYKALLALQQFHREGNLIQETSVNTSMLSLVVRGQSLGQILVYCLQLCPASLYFSSVWSVQSGFYSPLFLPCNLNIFSVLLLLMFIGKPSLSLTVVQSMHGLYFPICSFLYRVYRSTVLRLPHQCCELVQPSAQWKVRFWLCALPFPACSSVATGPMWTGVPNTASCL